MVELKWWQKAVVYQIYPRSFCDSNGDGIGDIVGIISKLDYLKDLGINVIWLSPVYRSPNDDNGYDISDYTDIQPEFGTMADMDELIAQAKKRGIKIIMDLVLNHTSDEHEWFVKSREGIEPYKDYYIWKDEPNNFTSFFTGSAWKYDEKAKKYYLHLFSPKQPDLNWHNPLVLEEAEKILRFWLDKGIAGFRCDVINVIYKEDYGNGIKRGGVTGVDKFVSKEGCHEILRRLNRDVLKNYDCFTVGETVMVNTDMAKDLCDPERGELDMVFGFEHMETDQISNKWFKTKFKPRKLKKVLAKWQKEIYWNANYFENHDQPRSVSRFCKGASNPALAAKMLAALLINLKGTPFIYEGQEIGMTNGDFKNLSEIQDVESHNVDKLAQKLHFCKSLRWKLIRQTSRDNARTPMQWSGGENAGFTSGKAWLKINANHKEINVESQCGDPHSVLNFYKRLIAFRKDRDALVGGEFELIKTGAKVIAYKRVLKNETYEIYCNFSSKPVKYASNGLEVALSNYIDLPTDGRLRAYEAIIARRTDKA